MIVYYISIPPIARIVGYDIDKYNTGCVFKEASNIGQFRICFKLVRHKLEVSFLFIRDSIMNANLFYSSLRNT